MEGIDLVSEVRRMMDDFCDLPHDDIAQALTKRIPTWCRPAVGRYGNRAKVHELADMAYRLGLGRLEAVLLMLAIACSPAWPRPWEELVRWFPRMCASEFVCGAASETSDRLNEVRLMGLAAMRFAPAPLLAWPTAELRLIAAIDGRRTECEGAILAIILADMQSVRVQADRALLAGTVPLERVSDVSSDMVAFARATPLPKRDLELQDAIREGVRQMDAALARLEAATDRCDDAVTALKFFGLRLYFLLRLKGHVDSRVVEFYWFDSVIWGCLEHDRWVKAFETMHRSGMESDAPFYFQALLSGHRGARRFGIPFGYKQCYSYCKSLDIVVALLRFRERTDYSFLEREFVLEADDVLLADHPTILWQFVVICAVAERTPRFRRAPTTVFQCKWPKNDVDLRGLDRTRFRTLSEAAGLTMEEVPLPIVRCVQRAVDSVVRRAAREAQERERRERRERKRRMQVLRRGPR